VEENLELAALSAPQRLALSVRNKLQPETRDSMAGQKLDVLALEPYRAGARMQHTGEGFERGALAGTVAAGQCNNFPPPHFHGYVEQNVRIAIVAVNLLYLDHIHSDRS
jgi:hypothetical protein